MNLIGLGECRIGPHCSRWRGLHPSRPDDCRYVGAQSGTGFSNQPLAGLQAVCSLARTIPETAAPDDVRDFQRHLMESGTSICTRNQTMTGVKFLFRVTLRRHDLAAEVFSLKEPVKVPLVLSGNEVKRILVMAQSLKARVMLSLAYGCGLRAGEVVRLRAMLKFG